MRITIAGGPMLPIPAIAGGAVPRMWQGLAEHFAGAGHDVTVCARAHPRQAVEETLNGVRYVRRGGFDQSRSVAWNLLRGVFDSFQGALALREGDILVTNDFWLPALAPYLRPAAGRVIVNANRFPKRQYRLYRRAAAIVAVSMAVAKAIRAQAPELAERVVVIPNALSIRAFATGATVDRQDGAPLMVLYVGRVHPEKGLELAIDAVRIAIAGGVPARLTIVGPHLPSEGGGGATYLQALRARAAGLPVTFEPAEFDVARLARRYGMHDTFCYPSVAERGEALGVAPIEAMAAGLVPIVSGLDCFDDVVEHDVSGLRFDHRAGDAARQVARHFEVLFRQVRVHRRLRQAARERAAAFDFATVGRRYEALFESVAAS